MVSLTQVRYSQSFQHDQPAKNFVTYIYQYEVYPVADSETRNDPYVYASNPSYYSLAHQTQFN